MTRKRPGTALYRLGDPADRDGFWATDRDYPAYVHPESTAPLWTATLSPSARIRKVERISEAAIRAAKRRGLDGVVCSCWDFAGDEYVVFRPEILLDVHRAERTAQQ